ncbi:MAG TPA: arylamine N-acetyltransferase [Opitutaceae bacterium]|nr:arylamine N-acetyltransferase [Opitutaceae bacterium]
MPLDLDAYFARIGCTGPRTPTLATLRALHLRHVNAIPFENLDVLLGRGVRIDLESVERKLVHERRGGYCFEHNSLFAAVLRALGFAVTPCLARIRWQKPAGERSPLTHMVLRVRADGRDWLADVGMGAVGATAPLALDTEAEQITPHETRLLARDGAKIIHRMRLGQSWGDIYEFTLEEPLPVEFEIANWFSCSHPKAHFMNNLVVTRVAGDRRLAIANREFVIRARDGTQERRELTSPEDLLEVLAQSFDLKFPPRTRFEAPASPWPSPS